jgi:uncharacterized BrkB/YihY/UPF0761 family membrane protein
VSATSVDSNGAPGSRTTAQQPPSRIAGVIATAKEVKTRVKEVRAAQLVSTITLRTFLSLFPLLLVGVAILGFIAANRKGGDDLAREVIDQLKLKDDMAKLVEENIAAAKGSRKAASVIGLVSSLFAGLAVVSAIASACDAIWQVPERGIKDRLLGLPWILGAVLIAALAGLATSIVKFLPIPGLNLVTGFLAGGITGALLFGWTQLVLTNIRVPLRAYLPGAIVGGLGLSAFQLFGAYVVARLLSNASQLYASLASVIALLSAFSLFGWLLVVSIVVNVVIWERRNGTVQLAVHAPRLPNGGWSMAQRGGQRSVAKSGGGLPAKLASFARRR